MIFKDLKPGHILYVMNRETLEIKKGSVTNVSAPHIESKLNSTCQFVVDVTVKTDDKLVTYVAPDGATVTYCGNMIVTSDKQYILGEINSIKTQCEQVLSSIDAIKTRLNKCNTAISELDDAYREKQYMENRFASIERCQKEMQEGQREMKEMIREFINKKSI